MKAQSRYDIAFRGILVFVSNLKSLKLRSVAVDCEFVIRLHVNGHANRGNDCVINDWFKPLNAVSTLK